MSRKITAVLFVLLLCIPCILTGCKKSDTPEVLYFPKFETTQDAIDYALNYVVRVQNGDEVTNQFYAARIIGETFGFTNFYNPKYGTRDAVQNPDGSITVTAEGSMSGTFKDGTAGKKVFTLTAVITSEKEMPKITVKEKTASL